LIRRSCLCSSRCLRASVQGASVQVNRAPLPMICETEMLAVIPTASLLRNTLAKPICCPLIMLLLISSPIHNSGLPLRLRIRLRQPKIAALLENYTSNPRSGALAKQTTTRSPKSGDTQRRGRWQAHWIKRLTPTLDLSRAARSCCASPVQSYNLCRCGGLQDAD
jgi:hypothetical protein